MEQHAIPQQISSYEFKLVGSMTLKQFFKLAGGLLIAFVIYSSQMIFVLKWPLVLFFGFSGFALAFMPINERPLDEWFIIFIQGILSPTVYLWQKRPTAIDILEEAVKYQGGDNEEEKGEERKEEERKRIEMEEFLASLPITKRLGPVPEDETEPEEEPPQPGPETDSPGLSPEEEEEPEKKAAEEKRGQEDWEPDLNIELPKHALPQATAEAEFGEIPMPKPPTTPNVIVGMVTDYTGKIIEDVIIEIQDSIGNPARALRTNQLGQFRTTAPLANGEYIILMEKENYQFDIIKLKAEGEIIPPLKIKAKPI
ncbi:MAG: hypothetical protein ABH867_03665 [Patescibacteria group bacterium]